MKLKTFNNIGVFYIITCRGDRNDFVVIGVGNAGLSTAISAMLTATDAMMVLGEVAERTVYEFKAFPREPINIQLKEYGTYRKFEKRDKRKNFRK